MSLEFVQSGTAVFTSTIEGPIPDVRHSFPLLNVTRFSQRISSDSTLARG